MAVGKRVKYIDIARGIAMLSIFFGHLGLFELDRVVFTFHVSMFYFITGYFLSKKYDVKTFIKDKAHTLLVPYAVTCVVMVIFGMIFAALLEGYDVLEEAKHWIYASIYGSGVNYSEPFEIKRIGALWFLLASFWGCIFLRISLEMKKKFRLLFILLLFFVGYWTAKELFWFPFSIQAGCCATLFMYIGYLVRRSKDVYSQLPKEVKYAGAGFALIIWLAFIKNYQSFWLVENNFGRGAIDIFGSICACYIVLLVSRFIENHSKLLTGLLEYVGRYSILVLCLHILELNLFPWWYIKNIFLGVGIWDSIADIMIIGIRIGSILMGTFLLSKIKPVTKLFGIK